MNYECFAKILLFDTCVGTLSLVYTSKMNAHFNISSRKDWPAYFINSVSKTPTRKLAVYCSTLNSVPQKYPNCLTIL